MMKQNFFTNKSVIILDLDYTIFQTNTIDKKVFEPFFENLLTNIKPFFTNEIIENIVADLWKYSWDEVIEMYNIPKEIFNKSIKVLEQKPLKLEISTYQDYKYINHFLLDKFLVTTGLTSLQNAKIEALDIRNDFKKIIINDRLIETKSKFDIFQELMTKYNLAPDKTYVIGDNPNSEILAGNKLNLNTIQIVRNNEVKEGIAKYYISSFEELKYIIHE